MSFIGQLTGKRGGKSKAPLPASSSLFALGTNTNVTPSSSSTSSASSKIGIKREACLREQLIPSKRGKIYSGKFQTCNEWKDNLIEVDANILLRKVLEADNANNVKKVIGYIYKNFEKTFVFSKNSKIWSLIEKVLLSYF